MLYFVLILNIEEVSTPSIGTGKVCLCQLYQYIAKVWSCQLYLSMDIVWACQLYLYIDRSGIGELNLQETQLGCVLFVFCVLYYLHCPLLSPLSSTFDIHISCKTNKEEKIRHTEDKASLDLWG